MPDVAIAALKRHRVRQAEERLKAGPLWAEQGLVFTTLVGGPLGARNVIRAFHALLDRAGLRHQRIHDLRHGCASLLAASGADLRQAMEILGHSGIGITANLYTHIYESVKREAMQRVDVLLSAR